MECLMAVDPGRHKCGLAVADRQQKPLLARVVCRQELAAAVRSAMECFSPQPVLLGDGTASAEVAALLRDCGCRPIEVDETGSTLEARGLYFEENKPRGWLRLLPRSFLVPPVDYDDYVARILIKRYLGGCR